MSIKENRPDVVTLDLNLPDLDGVEVCRRLRKFSEAYVLMITARVDEIDELIGLETGADDFISKPFSPRTRPGPGDSGPAPPPPHPATPHPAAPGHRLPARRGHHAATRRARRRAGRRPEAPQDPATPGHRAEPRRRRSPQPALPAPPGERSPRGGTLPAEPAGPGGLHRRQDSAGVVRHGPLVVEVEGRTASLDGVELVLTRTEFDLLEALAGAPRRVWTRKALLTKVWGTEWPMDEHLVEVHIGNLRRKLGDKGREPRFIRTVRGVGYRMAPAEEVA